MDNRLQKLMIMAGAGVLAAMPAGYLLSQYTVDGMRHDYQYGYQAPDPNLIAQAQSDGDASSTNGGIAALSATIKPASYRVSSDDDSYEAVYFPADSGPAVSSGWTAD